MNTFLCFRSPQCLMRRQEVVRGRGRRSWQRSVVCVVNLLQLIFTMEQFLATVAEHSSDVANPNKSGMKHQSLAIAIV